MMKLAKALFDELATRSKELLDDLKEEAQKSSNEISGAVSTLAQAVSSLAVTVQSHAITLAKHERLIQQLASVVIEGQKQGRMSMDFPETKSKSGSNKPN